MDMIRAQVTILCKKVRDVSIHLTDSFNYSDFIINSPMGRYDGNIYEKYFEQVNISHKAAQIPTYFKSHIYPVLNKKFEEESVLELDDE